MQVGPRIPVGIQLEKAEIGPTSGPTWRLSRSGAGLGEVDEVVEALQLRRQHAPALPPSVGFGRIVASEIEVPNMLVNLVQSG